VKVNQRWYILHTCNHYTESTSLECKEQLERICKGYRKGSICDKLRHELTTGKENACKRAKKLVPFNNPSTSVYLLLNELDKV
jgi:alpha-glucosidase (family GH31 glycosyl hydrolase)